MCKQIHAMSDEPSKGTRGDKPDSRHRCVRATCVDTGRKSMLHGLFRVNCEEIRNPIVFFAITYVLIVLFHFVVPTTVAFATMGDLITADTISDKNLIQRSVEDEDVTASRKLGRQVRVPYLRDYNVVFMSLVTLPFLVILLLTERPFICSCIKGLTRSGTIQLTQRSNESEFDARWTTFYGRVNIIAVCVGIVGASLASWENYIAQHAPGFGGWQFNPKYSAVSSWIFLAWQMPLLWFIVIVYACRAGAHFRFLWALVGDSKVHVNFFHRDRCGGLREIGRLGLRNQYSLSIVGVNLILMVIVLVQTNPPCDSTMGNAILGPGLRQIGPMLDVAANHAHFGPIALQIVIICVVFYLVGAPIAFLGPLIPFHRPMQEAKHACLDEISGVRQREYDRIVKNCSSSGCAEADIQSIERIERLQSLAERFPVWPFDLGTLRRFSLSYFAPLATAIGMKLADELIQWLMIARHSSG
jgi:hypothetical protein